MTHRIACWKTTATDTHSECVIHFAFPWQPRLHESAPLLRYTYNRCLVLSYSSSNKRQWVLCTAQPWNEPWFTGRPDLAGKAADSSRKTLARMFTVLTYDDKGHTYVKSMDRIKGRPLALTDEKGHLHAFCNPTTLKCATVWNKFLGNSHIYVHVGVQRIQKNTPWP